MVASMPRVLLALWALVMLAAVVQASGGRNLLQSSPTCQQVAANPKSWVPQDGQKYYVCTSGAAKGGYRAGSKGPYPSADCSVQCYPVQTIVSPGGSSGGSGAGSCGSGSSGCPTGTGSCGSVSGGSQSGASGGNTSQGGSPGSCGSVHGGGSSGSGGSGSACPSGSCGSVNGGGSSSATPSASASATSSGPSGSGGGYYQSG